MEDVVVDIGVQLREQREKLNYSLQEAAQHTRIRKTYLESIENNNFSDLPGHAYVSGFIKSYALYLGLDYSCLLAQLEEHRLSDGPPSLKPISVVKHQSKRYSKSSSVVNWSFVAIGMLGVLVLGCATYFLMPILQNKFPAEVVSELVVHEKGSVQGAVQIKASVTGEPITGTGEEKQDVVASLQVEERPSVADELVAPELKPSPSIPAGGSSLRMLALSEGSLTIYTDNRKSHQYKLHEGLDLTWGIKEKVKVELAGPGMARFWLGGQELDLGMMDFFQLQIENGD